jgi:hypothetical protein
VSDVVFKVESEGARHTARLRGASRVMLVDSITARSLPHAIAMPPLPPTVEFRSLLLAPIRVRIQTLHTLSRPQCAPVALRRATPAVNCLAQRRSLHLYKTARAKTALSMHKILDFVRFDVKPPSESTHRVNLVRWEKRKEVENNFTIVKENLSLEELYEQVSHGQFIFQADLIPKKLDGKFKDLRDQNIPAQSNNYAIGITKQTEWNAVDQVSQKVKRTAQKDGNQRGALKTVIMLLSNPLSYKLLSLDRAYQFVELGSPVEFRIRLHDSAVATKKKGTVPDPELVPWMMDHFPHLRPDFILKAMPAGTKYVIDPVTDGRTVQFVVGKDVKQAPKLNLTTRLFRVKKAVEDTLPNNPMAQHYHERKTKQPDQKVSDGEGLTISLGEDAAPGDEEADGREMKAKYMLRLDKTGVIKKRQEVDELEDPEEWLKRGGL